MSAPGPIGVDGLEPAPLTADEIFDWITDLFVDDQRAEAAEQAECSTSHSPVSE